MEDKRLGRPPESKDSPPDTWRIMLRSGWLRLQLPLLLVTAISIIALTIVLHLCLDAPLNKALVEKDKLSALNLAGTVSEQLAQHPGTIPELDFNNQEHNDADLKAVSLIDSRAFAKKLVAAEQENVTETMGNKMIVQQSNGNSDAMEIIVAVPTLKDKELYLKFEFTNKRVKSLTFVTIAIALGMSIVAYLLRSYFSKTIMAEEIAPSMKRVTDQASLIAGGDLAAALSATDAELLSQIQDKFKDEELDSFVNSMGEMVSYLSDMAKLADVIAGGDLTVQLTPRSEKDVFGIAYKRMVDSFRSIAGQLVDSSSELREVSNELAGSSSQQTSQTADQAESLTAAAAALEQIKLTLTQATDNTRSVLDISQQAVTAARAGRDALRDSTQAVKKLRQQVSTISKNISDLTGKLTQISEITASVNDIAEQSKLLAINAAIEAIRAGESGRGFTVVAGAVKELAHQSKRAMAEVNSLIEEILSSASATTMVTIGAAQLSEKEVAVLQRIRENFDILSNVIEQSAEIAKEVAAATYLQTSRIDELALGMKEISAAATINATRAQEQNPLTVALSNLSGRIARIVASYKV